MGQEMEPARLVDYHLHTAVTIDGKMNEVEACARAVELGFQEIAFTNHVMLNQPDYLMSQSSFLNHWENIQGCLERFPQLQIRLGIEMDYYPNRVTEIGNIVEHYERLIGRPFDFVLGAVHEIEGGFFSSKRHAPAFFQSRDLLSLYYAYFDLVTRAVQSGLFDIMAHPDLIKKYTHEFTQAVPFERYAPAVDLLITALISCGVGIEVNTKGLKLSVKETYPSMEFLQLYLTREHSSGADPIITIGSDAHKVDELGFGILEMAESLKILHVKKLMSFVRREKIPITI